ncbi:small acid-soluble spore protein Tlp [Lysinibacillus irui]|uniref:Small, acid-soluble spore protein Tlp n=1 Tax=Lysinibacillus irui TaxID=2998077 RepID=A0AAJ5UT50_9BACI|nr:MULTISPECIES: small acid-soluble spore protein Tlp [Lysinibacillus]MEA0552457.1 small acid-soluble spore protein Tlp [Lysinibacillus irui]MEA0562833.1 small acid-soluble spore protein Tlp [Lysinibacillus irui]MEA0978409.1 small acid-soluble spore protein Tlp [Lysinibacillus irui]MEA1044563.1 small acid-soluble spore protein Tlp [Lysinibacillus irui]WDV06714.1 small acid-soluble spore protein Tlp [Lysinibacillus irui]
MANSRQRKPDDRSNNVERIQGIIKNTEEKLHEAEISMEFADPMQSKMVKEKNERRKQSIEALKDEMKDEMAARKNGEV